MNLEVYSIFISKVAVKEKKEKRKKRLLMRGNGMQSTVWLAWR